MLASRGTLTRPKGVLAERYGARDMAALGVLICPGRQSGGRPNPLVQEKSQTGLYGAELVGTCWDAQAVSTVAITVDN
jgi:hypothetical protein